MVRRRTSPLVVGAFLAVGAVLTAFPFFWMLTTSLKPLAESYTYPPTVIPSTVTLLSYLRLFRDFDFGRYLVNTLVGIALPTLVSAFNIFLFRQFMTTIPDELLEAARLDGAGELRILWSIVLPVSKPILAVGGVLTFITGWNSFIWPLIIANDQHNYTLSVGISLLNKQLAINPPLQMAGAALMVIPIMVVFVLFQRYIVRGFTMSGLR